MRKLFYAALLAVAIPASAGAAPAAMPVQAPVPAFAPVPAPVPVQAMVALLGEMSGAVEVQLGGTDIWRRAQAGESLPAGTTVKTASGSSCVVVFNDRSQVRLDSNTNLKLEDVSSTKVGLFMGVGRLDAWVKKLTGRAFEIRTPTATAAVRGTTLRIETDANGTRTYVFDGVVVSQNQLGQMLTANAGQTITVVAKPGVVAIAGQPVPPPAPGAPAVAMNVVLTPANIQALQEPVIVITLPPPPPPPPPAPVLNPPPPAPAPAPVIEPPKPEPQNPKQETEEKNTISPSTP